MASKNYKRPGTVILMALGVLSLILIGFSAWAQECPEDISNYWKLDETSGPTFSDSVAGNNADCTGSACPGSMTGKISNALIFDGLDDGITAPAAASFDWNSSDSFSVELWMKTDPSSTCSGNQVLVGRDDSVTPLHWWVGCWNNTGKAAFVLIDTAGNLAILTGISDLTDGNWHHITAVRDAGANEVRLYVDGVKEASTLKTYTSGFDSTTAALNIGWLNLGAGFHFAGTIDEVALHGRALSDAEISSHFYIVRGYCDMCSSPVRIMPLGDSITSGYDGNAPGVHIGYRRPLYLDLINGGYFFDFVGSLQDGPASPDFDIDHEGHDGYMTEGPFGFGEVVPNVYNWLVANPAEVTLLHIGTNDVANNGQDPNEIARLLDEIDRYSADVTVILARIIKVLTAPDATTQYNDAVVAMASNRIMNGDKIIIVDMENALTYPDDMSSTLHPNQTGYGKMAGVWMNVLRDFSPVCAQVAPSIVSTPITEVPLGEPYTYDVEAFGNPAPTFSLTTAPAGMTINPGSGLVEWTPSSVGIFDVAVSASNSVGTDGQIFSLQVVQCPQVMSHYWKLDEIASPYDDLYGNPAVCGSCPAATGGIVNGAQQFTETTQVNVADDDTFDWAVTDSFSIEFWMKTDPASTCAGNQVVIGRDDGSIHWWVGCLNGGTAAFCLYDRSRSGTCAVGSTTDLTDGLWHHVVAVRDASTGQDRLYVDGTMAGSANIAYAFGFDSAAAGLNIGWLNLSAGFHFIGTVDELALYNRVLPEGEILDHYADGSTGSGYCYVSHTVTPSAGPNGTIDPSTPQTVIHGGTVQFTVTPQAGYRASVTGTCGGTLVGETYTTNPIVEDCTVVAAFAKKVHTVTPSAGPNGSIDPSTPQEVVHGDTVQFAVTPDTGYHISSVTGTCEGTLSGTIFTTGPITKDCTVTASFTINTYTVTPSAGANGSISPNTPQTVDHNATASFTVTPNAGYHIASVTGCGGTLTGSTYTTGPVTADCAVAASFAINTYTVTPSAGANGSISPNTPQTVNHGSTAQFTVTPNTGYHIDSVAGTCGGVLSGNSYTTGPITANCTVIATFAINTYTIAASAGTGGTISPAGATIVNHGANLTFTITPNASYRIADVKVDGSSMGTAATHTFSNITANHSIDATFVGIYSISGTVRVGRSPVAGFTVTLNGSASGTATTDSLGNYSFSGLANGSYTVTPIKNGYRFAPVSRAVIVSGASVTRKDFLGKLSTATVMFAISGTVSAGGSPMAGVTVTLSGAESGTANTDSLGSYSFSGLVDGNYTVTPGKAGYTFTPESRAVAISGAEVTGQDFTATSAGNNTYRISGRVLTAGTRLSPGSPISGVTITLSGTANGTATTDADGNYAFTGLENGNYTLTPGKTGFSFTPSFRSVSVNGANVAGQNFTGTSQ